ncbi:hypothetical protein QJS10_CPA01g00009 [Acorus calamus]|uniref:C2H2-type domain-containing protein n=1 Tax=Acorus calamus TaxID=4465 RepID=A0AAV9FH91_ACOCL|nr:hypothetical protein QJS10_CPA01g00009 [Acorus calamus]
MMEGIFIRAAPHCLKSFLRRSEFEAHVHEMHADLQTNAEKEVGSKADGLNAPRPTSLDIYAKQSAHPESSTARNNYINHLSRRLTTTHNRALTGHTTELLSPSILRYRIGEILTCSQTDMEGLLRLVLHQSLHSLITLCNLISLLIL